MLMYLKKIFRCLMRLCLTSESFAKLYNVKTFQIKTSVKDQSAILQTKKKEKMYYYSKRVGCTLTLFQEEKTSDAFRKYRKKLSETTQKLLCNRSICIAKFNI